MILTTYGRSSAASASTRSRRSRSTTSTPARSVLSFGTAGCNLACKFCQNWDISKSREMDTLMDDATPEAIARAAQRHGSQSVAFTYNDPVIFAEYAMDTADACHALGIKTVAVTAGYMHLPAATRVLRQDGRRQHRPEGVSPTSSTSSSASATCSPCSTCSPTSAHETNCWLEITTLLIPGQNDSDARIEGALRLVREGTRAPTCRCTSPPSIPTTSCSTRRPRRPATLRRARQIALDAGLRYVYTGNVHDRGRRRHLLPRLRQGRDRARLVRDSRLHLDDTGHCQHCGTAIAGRFGHFDKPFGARRIPVRLHAP